MLHRVHQHVARGSLKGRFWGSLRIQNLTDWRVLKKRRWSLREKVVFR